MANFRINCSQVLNSSGRCDNAKNNIQNAREKVAYTNSVLDNQIKQRDNIYNRLNNVSNNLEDIKKRVSSIQNVCNNSARNYQNIDKTISKKAVSIKNSTVGRFK